MRSGQVYYQNFLAGVIRETDDGDFVFQYDALSVQDHPTEFITFTMACCQNCIGAVSVVPLPEEDEE